MAAVLERPQALIAQRASEGEKVLVSPLPGGNAQLAAKLAGYLVESGCGVCSLMWVDAYYDHSWTPFLRVSL